MDGNRNILATAGRDKTIKVWDTSDSGAVHGLEHTIHTIGKIEIDNIVWPYIV
jgi:WD40 repeat protein